MKGPSNSATAGSDRNMSKHDLSRGSSRGRATDWETRLREESASLSNSERANAVDGGSPVSRGKLGHREGNNPELG